MAIYRITDYEARADGKTDNRIAIQKAIDTCHEAGGGRVLIPGPGVFVSGGIELKSGVELHLEQRAVLKASPEFAAHNPLRPLSNNFNESSAARLQDTEFSCFIIAKNAEDIVFSGPGTIDGNARAYRDSDLGPIYRMVANRPRLILLEGCQRITARDITIRDGSYWTFHPIGCKDVLIDGIRIYNDLKTPNCDGIDPDHCQNVRIANCHVEAGDDAIVLKNHGSYPEFGPCENITITNCTLISTSAAFKIGTESCGHFRNIAVSNCMIDRSNRALSIQLRDWGNVENVFFSNIAIRTRLFDNLWWGKAEPIAITAQPRREGDSIGTIRGVHFSNIRAEGEAGVLVWASPEAHIEDISFDNVAITLVKTTGHPCGWKDLRPTSGDEHGGCDRHPLHGFLLENLHQVALRNCRVRFAENRHAPAEGKPESWTGALFEKNNHGLQVENLQEDGL
ncbi:MAG: glycoside hydrolase family 28 protein [Opitutales bacterium]|nr:glycoside hydrolase family 28 protein [Opitutales bacterium]